MCTCASCVTISFFKKLQLLMRPVYMFGTSQLHLGIGVGAPPVSTLAFTVLTFYSGQTRA